MKLPSVQDCFNISTTKEDYIVSMAYLNRTTVVGDYYGYSTRYLVNTTKFDMGNLGDYLSKLFKAKTDSTLKEVIGNIESSVSDGICEAYGDLLAEDLTALVNIYLKNMFQVDATIDDIVQDVDDLVAFLSTPDKVEGLKKLTSYIVDIFIRNNNNREIILESIESNLKTTVNEDYLYCLLKIVNTPLCGVIGNFPNENIFKLLSYFKGLDKVTIVGKDSNYYQLLKLIEDSSESFTKYGFIECYFNSFDSGMTRDKLTVFKTTDGDYRILR